MEESRVCSKCYIEKPLTEEFFGPQPKNKARLHTECRVCKKAYLKKWQADRRAEQEVDKKREKHMYTIKEVTEEEKENLLDQAYAYIYRNAFGRSITRRQLDKLKDNNK